MPSDPPFDVIMYNAEGEITETSIANIAVRLDAAALSPWITPRAVCGLLPGVMRAELIEKGEIEEGHVSVDELTRAAEVSHALQMGMP